MERAGCRPLLLFWLFCFGVSGGTRLFDGDFTLDSSPIRVRVHLDATVAHKNHLPI